MQRSEQNGRNGDSGPQGTGLAQRGQPTVRLLCVTACFPDRAGFNGIWHKRLCSCQPLDALIASALLKCPDIDGLLHA